MRLLDHDSWMKMAERIAARRRSGALPSAEESLMGFRGFTTAQPMAQPLNAPFPSALPPGGAPPQPRMNPNAGIQRAMMPMGETTSRIPMDNAKSYDALRMGAMNEPMAAQNRVSDMEREAALMNMLNAINRGQMGV